MRTTPRQRLVRRAAILASALGLSCGGEELPLCPNGDCTLPSSTVVRWTLNSYPELLFQGDTCIDLGVKTMRVELTNVDDPAIFDFKDVDCNQTQASFLGLPAGDYTAVLTPLDDVGDSMVRMPTMAVVPAGVGSTPAISTVNLPFEHWLRSYTGTLLFRLSWAGVSCEAAVPAVTTQTLTLMAGGNLASVLTDTGQRLDGSDPKPCRLLTEPFAQFAEGLPAGPATLTIVGRDATDTVAFEKTFDTFVGAAKNNPTITYDVTVSPPADAAPAD